jgi:cold shock CspA family protein
MFDSEFSEADDIITPVLDSAEISMLARRKAYDVWLQIAVWSANKYSEKGDFGKALEMCESLISRFEEIPENYVDDKIVVTARRSLQTLSTLTGRLTLDESQDRIHRCEARLNALQPALPPRLTYKHSKFRLPEDSDVAKNFEGAVVNVEEAKKYGFIQYEGSKTLFFRFSSLVDVRRQVNVGTEVKFTVAKQKGKFCAINIIVAPSVIVTGQVLKGVVKGVPPGKNFGFIFGEDDKEYFFHISNIDNGITLEMLKPGTRVRFQIARYNDEIVADHVCIVG